LNGKTTFEKWTGKKPDARSFNVPNIIKHINAFTSSFSSFDVRPKMFCKMMNQIEKVMYARNIDLSDHEMHVEIVYGKDLPMVSIMHSNSDMQIPSENTILSYAMSAVESVNPVEADPKTYREAMSSENAVLWKKELQHEYNSKWCCENSVQREQKREERESFSGIRTFVQLHSSNLGMTYADAKQQLLQPHSPTKQFPMTRKSTSTEKRGSDTT
jgi:hypothetical protein